MLQMAINWKNNNDETIFRYDVIFVFFDVALFLFEILVTGPRFMSISLLVLDLWQFSFIRDWLEIGNRKYLRLSIGQYYQEPGGS